MPKKNFEFTLKTRGHAALYSVGLALFISVLVVLKLSSEDLRDLLEIIARWPE